MPVLNTSNRRDVLRRAMDLAKIEQRNWPAVTKPDIEAAIAALDAWLETNAANINAAIPQPARGALNAKHKAILVGLIALVRAEVA